MGRAYIGAMSGTSMDAIDVAVFCFEQTNTPPYTLLAQHRISMPTAVRTAITQIQTQDIPLTLLAQLDHDIGALYAQAILDLLKQQQTQLQPYQIAAIGMHGQTLRHEPRAPTAFTWQAGDANIVAKRTGIITVADFRRADMANGGQGAPLASCFHRFAFHDKDQQVVVVNLGGIANVSLLAKDGSLISFDCGPGMCLMDRWTQKHQQQSYDDRGLWASQARADARLLACLMKHPFIAMPAPKSACVCDFSLGCLEQCLEQCSPLSPTQVQATLLAFTAQAIVEALQNCLTTKTRIIVCGGGAYNDTLIKHLKKQTGVQVQLSDDYGLPVQAVETAAFAWLARQRLQNKPASEPATTGVSQATVLGAIYKWYY